VTLLVPERLFTPSQVGRLLGVHKSTVRRWVRSGEVTAIRLPGGAYRIREAEIKRLSKPVGKQDSPTRVAVSS
jgi:excisionase family DNA binding protein